MKNDKFSFKRNVVSIFTLLILVISIFGCKKDDTIPPPPVMPGENVPLRQYDASATIGDIVSITVNDNNNTISYNNKTTGESGATSFTRVTSGIMKGALKINIDNEDYYLLEIPNQLIMSYLPFNMGEEMIVGVIKHNYTPGDHYGRWLFFGYDPSPFDNNYWGMIDIYTNNRFDLELWDFSGTIDHTETGSWLLNSSDPSTVYSIADSNNDTIVETIYVLPDKLRVYDSGPQAGMGIGFAEPDQPITITDIVGSYATVWAGGYGNYNIQSDGNLNASFYIDNQLYDNIIYSDFRRTTPSDAIHFNNTFFFTDYLMPGPIQDVYLFVLPGDAILAVYYDQGEGMLSAMAVRVNR